MSGERQSAIITTIIGGGLESSSRSLPFLFIAKKRDGAVQQRGLMSRFYSFWGTFPNGENGVAYLFSAPAGRDARTAQAVRPDGRKVSRRTSAGSAPSADGGDVAVPAAGAKRKGHLRFPFLFELLPFPCSDSTVVIREKGPLRKGERQRIFLCYGRTTFGVRPHEQPIRSIGYRTATQAVYSTQARHNSAAQFVSLEITDSTYEDK